ncbi:hypothetical protein [Haloplanus halophilus]|nr:hypothetical protein [Haloplanus sp. GDY1]
MTDTTHPGLSHVTVVPSNYDGDEEGSDSAGGAATDRRRPDPAGR